MKTKLHTFSAIALVAVFGLSNIGLPIVMYLCPMMQDDPSECQTECENPSQTLAIVNQSGTCCNSYIVAERNTTPFVKTEKSSPAISVALLPMTLELSDNSSFAVQNVPCSVSPQASPPIFLLNSSFLI
ncbi:MAG: hypothetical protein L0287_19875 [Anaerolineae bacterium]|nr:hypothetical protein [Anaerolineae bacterium]MCI0707483.1 hypothetical protein [Ignavibacteriota bacterium]